MIAFPIAATVVAALFTAGCGWTAARRRSPAMAIWSAALAQFAVAAGALSLGSATGWEPALYRTYYLFGAVLNVVWLGLGTVWLLVRGPVAWVAGAVVAGLTVYAAVAVWGAEFLPGAANALQGTIPAGGEVIPPSVRLLSRTYSIAGSVVVLAGLGWSIARRREKAAGLGLLAAGVVVVAVASELGRLDLVLPFSAGLAAGIGLMYVGFLRT